jgi:hypothetical protein
MLNTFLPSYNTPDHMLHQSQEFPPAINTALAPREVLLPMHKPVTETLRQAGQVLMFMNRFSVLVKNNENIENS